MSINKALKIDLRGAGKNNPQLICGLFEKKDIINFFYSQNSNTLTDQADYPDIVHKRRDQGIRVPIS